MVMNRRQERQHALCCERARERGGECISSEYRGAHSKLHWGCAVGHEWLATSTSIQKGHWCPMCARDARDIIDRERVFFRVRTIARSKGGRCLSTEYVNVKSPLRWSCAAGHEWEATATSISSGTWCRRCSTQTLGLEDMQKLARARDGSCLSSEYVNVETEMRWRCAEGHEWRATGAQLRGGAWCPTCAAGARRAKQDQTLAEVQAIARAKGGMCLATLYVDSGTSMHFRCAAGHEWSTSPRSIKEGHWCRICGQTSSGQQERERAFIRVLAVATKKGGFCISTSYADAVTRLRWRCAEGHEWSARPTSIQQGRWCPECSFLVKRRRQFMRGGSCFSPEYLNAETCVGAAMRKLSRLPAKLSCDMGCDTDSCSPQWISAYMREIAGLHGGRCTSESIDGDVELSWECSEGHQWRAYPNVIQGGGWCPMCMLKSKKKRPR